MEIIKKLYSQKIILFTLALIINSCGIYVQYDYDSDVDFNNYNSYSFYEPDIEKVEISDLDKKRILKSLDMGLKSKGLERSSSPDLLITFETQSKRGFMLIIIYPMAGVLFLQISILIWILKSSRYSYVNFIDSKNQQLVWQGKGVGVLNEYSKDRDKMISNFVSSILEKFPPTAD